MKSFNIIQVGTLTTLFALSATAFSSLAVSAPESGVSVTNDWQSSLAAEFSKLDTSGNGLLLRSEASKGKAFNKKTFNAADADNDGTLNQEEYINHRTSTGATNQPGVASMGTDSMSKESNSADSMGSDKGTDSMGTEKATDSMGIDKGTDSMSTDGMSTDKKGTDSMGTENMGTEKGADSMGTDGMSTDKKGTDSTGTDSMEH